MDTFIARKGKKRSAHGYFYCPEGKKEVSTWILLLPGSGERGQHMDTFIARNWRKRSALGYFYRPELKKEVSTWILLIPGSGERSQHIQLLHQLFATAFTNPAFEISQLTSQSFLDLHCKDKMPKI
jgi:hypothetical protein